MEDLFKRLGVNIDVSFHLIYYSLIWVRIIAMGSVVPFIFGKPVPRYVLMAGSVVLALFAYRATVPAEPPPLSEDRMLLVVLYLKEAFYGAAIGFSAAVIFHAMSSVGQMIDNQRGVSIARSILPQLGEQVSITGIFLFQLGLVLFLAIGGHLMFFDTFFMSFRALPVLEFPAAGPGMFPLMDMFMKLTGQVLLIAMKLSMPVIIAIFMADLILGIANRIAPQINVWMLGFTLKGSLGVLILFLSLTMVTDQMQRYGLAADRHVAEAIDLLQGKVPEGAPQPPAPEEGLAPESEIPDVKTIE
ncbi:MAG: flagellar biosynthetic protein FliR [Proteobacteria bacterium]|nr:flagellar biosynthetic protein FliR [Pseudomonadota bacterium]